MGGLFSGQGGFESCWEEVNGKGTALWSSEIEPHAAAVMRFHFTENENEIPSDMNAIEKTEQEER